MHTLCYTDNGCTSLCGTLLRKFYRCSEKHDSFPAMILSSDCVDALGHIFYVGSCDAGHGDPTVVGEVNVRILAYLEHLAVAIPQLKPAYVSASRSPKQNTSTYRFNVCHTKNGNPRFATNDARKGGLLKNLKNKLLGGGASTNQLLRPSQLYILPASSGC